MPHWLGARIFGARSSACTSAGPSATACPSPTTASAQAHPTVSGRILDRISHGAITPRPNIARLGTRRGRVHRRHARARRRRRLLHGLQDHVPVLRRGLHLARPTTTSSCSGASSQPRRRRTSRSSGCCSRSARSCRSPRRRASGSPSTCAASTACRRRGAMRGRHPPRGQAAMRKRYVTSQAPHDPGRLRRVPLRAAPRAPPRRARARPRPGSRCRCPRARRAAASGRPRA